MQSQVRRFDAGRLSHIKRVEPNWQISAQLDCGRRIALLRNGQNGHVGQAQLRGSSTGQCQTMATGMTDLQP